jgi:5-methylcytosine-specific restriction endonuclease McrA
MDKKDETRLRSAIRNVWRWSKERYEFLRANKVCSVCGERAKIYCDHTRPVVDPAVGFVDWSTYIARMFVDGSGYTALCEGCHKIKTKSERDTRFARLKKERANASPKQKKSSPRKKA